MFWFLVQIVGILAVLKVGIDCIHTFFVYHVLPEKLEKAESAWAVVTGASRGIGKAFVQLLAQRGFNIILISRSQNTLREIAKETQQKYNIETRVLGLDMSVLYKDLEMKKQIQKLFKQYKCQILIVNAAEGQNKIFTKYSLLQIDNMFFLNTHPHIYLSKLFLQEQKGIKKHIVHLSSLVTTSLSPRSSLYAGTKIFSDILARYQSYESQTNFVSVRPGFVDTQMVKDIQQKMLVAKPIDIASYSLKCLGRKNACKGTWGHIFLSYLMQLFPDYFVASTIKFALKLQITIRKLTFLKNFY